MRLMSKQVRATNALVALVAVLLLACSGCSLLSDKSVVKADTGPKESPYHKVSSSDSAKYYYQAVWGVDKLVARVAASGSLVRFSYRVTDPERAAVLADKHAKPAMYDPRSQRVLEIPVLEQVGALWQAGVEMKIEKGKEYWMTFSNKGQPVKPGDRVTVVIGAFRVDGLMVE